MRRRAAPPGAHELRRALVLAVPFALAVAAADLSPSDAFSRRPRRSRSPCQPPTNGFMVRHIPDEPLPPPSKERCLDAHDCRAPDRAVPPARPGREALSMAVSPIAPARPRGASPSARGRRGSSATRSACCRSKWAVDVLLALGDGTRRYHELLEDLSPISEKVLTQTLRAMERDGLVARRVHAEVPPRVEYALTPLAPRWRRR